MLTVCAWFCYASCNACPTAPGYAMLPGETAPFSVVRLPQFWGPHRPDQPSSLLFSVTRSRLNFELGNRGSYPASCIPHHASSKVRFCSLLSFAYYSDTPTGQNVSVLEDCESKYAECPERRRREAAQPRVEEHAKRALEPWVQDGIIKALKGRRRLSAPPFQGFLFHSFQPRAPPASRPTPWAVLLRAFSAWNSSHKFWWCHYIKRDSIMTGNGKRETESLQ